MQFNFYLSLTNHGAGYAIGYPLSLNRFCWAHIGYNGRVHAIDIYNQSGHLLPNENLNEEQ